MDYYYINIFKDFLTFQNIEKEKRFFISERQKMCEEADIPFTIIDEKNGIVEEYIESEHSTQSYLFESYIKHKINAEYLANLKNNIRQTLLTYKQNNSIVEEQKFRKFISSTITNKIIKQQPQLFIHYPYFKRLIRYIISFLNDYDFHIKPPTSILEPPPFKLKSEYTSKLNRLYNTCVQEYYISEEQIDQANFINVISGRDTLAEIRFICTTREAIALLHFISPIFEKFSGKIIEDSKRFWTKSTLSKQSTFITSSMYYTEKSRTNSKTVEKTKRFFNFLF